MFKRLAITFMCLILVFALAACGGAKDNADAGKDGAAGDAGTTKLTVWLWPGMGIEDQMKEYAAKNNIELDIQLSPFADVHSNLTTALAAGSGAPDISAVEVKLVEQFKENPDNFHNLLEFGADKVKADYLDWKWQQALTGDEKALLGLPTDIGPMAMAYRTDVFAKAGLPTDPKEVANQIKNWDDFIEAGKKVRANAGVGMIDSATSMFNVMVGQGEKKYFEPDGTLIVKDNPQVQKAWNYATKAIEANITANIDPWSTDWGTGMTKGDFAVMLAPAWMMGFMKENAPDASGKWDMALMPEGAGNWGGSFLTIPKQSKNAQAAYGLIQWLLSPEQQLVTFKNKGNFPSTPALFDTPELQEYKSEYFNNAPVGQIYADAARLVKPVYEGPYSQQVEDLLGKAVVRVEDKQQKADESWNQAIKEIERQMSRK
jgi:cellobiose transport system substrate-binding protein